MERPSSYYDRLPKSLEEIDFQAIIEAHGPYYPSPANWEDEVLYFLMVDRFSNAREYGGFGDIKGNLVKKSAKRDTPLMKETDKYSVETNIWAENGKTWCGGTIAGIRDKLGYLKRLGITVLWISPVFKQMMHNEGGYHGYGVQNFLDIDPHFGTREGLKELVAEAHKHGIRIILDIILNHAGNVFAYLDGHDYPYDGGRVWPVGGYRKDETDQTGSLPFEVIDLAKHPEAWPHGAVWPRELQDPETWTQMGSIKGSDWDAYPAYADGDFFSLKDIRMGEAITDPSLAWDLLLRIRAFKRSKTLVDLRRIFQFWIAYADIDGFRVDTVKHMEPGAVRYFCNVIHEFAQTLGKEQFYIIGEITGGRSNAVNVVDATGLDAALGIDDIQDKLEFLAKGRRSPGNPDTLEQEGYFDLFTNSLADGKSTNQWFARRIITLFDDHDQVGTTHKFRFCGQAGGKERLQLVMALNLTTMGIPCTYYGSEQALDGADPRGPSGDSSYSDVYLRESMFGGAFGAFRTNGKHVFDENSPAYRCHARLCALRNEYIALRRGRQYLRKISENGRDDGFYYPNLLHGELLWVVAWSRVFADIELVCAINTNLQKDLEVWVTVEELLHPPGDTLRCLFSTDESQEGVVSEVGSRNGASLKIRVPAGGFVLYG